MHQGKPRRKRCEEDVAILLAGLHVNFSREHVVKFNKSAPWRFARIDFFWVKDDAAIVFEVDEYAHRAFGYTLMSGCAHMWHFYIEMHKRGML